MSPGKQSIADPGSFAPVADGAGVTDPLGFPGYVDTHAVTRQKAGADESVEAGPATIDGIEVELALFDFGFLGGSMGLIAGERLARALERAAARKVPFVLRASTGGARMQEGMLALVQMPKVVVARRALADAHVPYVAVLGHPTTGGVFASVASLADVTVAESDATIGFAGPRVAERFTGAAIEGRSHTATTAFRHGLVDEVVPATEVRAFVAEALRTLAPDRPAEVSQPLRVDTGEPSTEPWDLVTAVRSETRPTTGDIVSEGADALLPLRGDRNGTDDPAVGAWIARLRGRRAVVLALQRPHAPGPGAYRKARRCIALAVRLELPIVTLVDTRGADPSSDSENAGIAGEIAATFDALLHAPVPTLSLVTGEGGSGGALAFACTDTLLALESSIFSVIAPEWAAEILWRDPTRAADAARLLKLSAHDLLRFGIADELIPDPLEPSMVTEVLAYHLDRLAAEGKERLLEARKERWRRRT